MGRKRASLPQCFQFRRQNFRDTQSTFRENQKLLAYTGVLEQQKALTCAREVKLHFSNLDKHWSSQKILQQEADVVGPLRIDFSGVLLQWRGCSCQYNRNRWPSMLVLESCAPRLPVCHLGWFSTSVTPITRALQHQITCLTLGRGAALFPDLLEWQSRNTVMKDVSS